MDDEAEIEVLETMVARELAAQGALAASERSPKRARQEKPRVSLSPSPSPAREEEEGPTRSTPRLVPEAETGPALRGGSTRGGIPPTTTWPQLPGGRSAQVLIGSTLRSTRRPSGGDRPRVGSVEVPQAPELLPQERSRHRAVARGPRRTREEMELPERRPIGRNAAAARAVAEVKGSRRGREAATGRGLGWHEAPSGRAQAAEEALSPPRQAGPRPGQSVFARRAPRAPCQASPRRARGEVPKGCPLMFPSSPRRRWDRPQDRVRAREERLAVAGRLRVPLHPEDPRRSCPRRWPVGRRCGRGSWRWR